MSLTRLPIILTSALSLLLLGTSWAADKPILSNIFPPAGQVNTSVDVLATGKFPRWPLSIWSSHPSIRWECQSESGKLRATVGPDVPVGVHWVRLYDAAGATDTRPFLVGKHPQQNEIEPNNLPSQANEVAVLPWTVNGTLSKRGDVDLFAVNLQAGQSLAVTVDSAKWLLSPADVSIQLLDSKGFVLAENLDHVGLDPYLEYQAKQTIQVIVKVFAFPAAPDSTIGFSGGADWNYRMVLSPTPEPFASTLDYDSQVLLDAQRIDLPPALHGTLEIALPVTLPARLGGTLMEPGQKQFFSFDAKTGNHYRVKAMAREFGSDLDPTLAIYDSKSKELVKLDDAGDVRDPIVNWVCPADGTYTIGVSDFHRTGGSRHRHLTTVEQVKPSFTLSVASEMFETSVNREVEIPIQILREAGFAGVISVALDGNPGAVQCSQGESKSGDETASKVVLKWTGSQPFQGPITIVGRSEGTPDSRASAPRSKAIWISVAE